MILTVDIYRVWEDHPKLLLGTIMFDDSSQVFEDGMGQDSSEWIKERWEDWLEDCPQANNDDEFLIWLTETYDCKIVDSNHQVDVGI